MTTDVIVVGAGALGLSTALHCALLGRQVVVLERDTAGSQASGRAAGLFKSVQADELRTVIARRSIQRATEFGQWAGEPLDVVASGSFLVARTPQHRAYLQAEQRQSAGWGADVSVAAPGAVSGQVSYYGGDGAELALWCPEDIYIEEPIALVLALAAACARHGVELAEAEPVTDVTLNRGAVDGVVTPARTIRAPAVVDAAGAWVRQVAELAGASVALAPVRHQLLITAPVPGLEPGQPIVRVVDAAVYLRPARAGLMFGGFEAGPLPADPRALPPAWRTADLELDAGVLAGMAAQVAAEVPLVAGLQPDWTGVAEHRGGLFTMSPDGRFVTGPVPGVPGLWVASGCNGSGFSSALGLGEALAAWICDVPGRLDITALAPGRFAPLSDTLLSEDGLVAAGVWQYAHYYDPASTPG
jgi:glycine/D-amino acid oxidase-like deaminating enzyme